MTEQQPPSFKEKDAEQARQRFLFLELGAPPPFYQPHLSEKKRTQYDKWFIGSRSQNYYLTRFADFDKQQRLGMRWHWAAFFITLPWLLYRKRYMDALVYSVAGWSFMQLMVAIALVAAEHVLMPFVPDAWHMTLRMVIGGGILFIIAVFVAAWADAYYYRMARREIADVIEADYDDEQAKAHLAREGGVSMVGMGWAFGLFVFALLVIKQQFLPIYAEQRESEILYTVYDVANQTKLRASAIYDTAGACPPNMPSALVHTKKVSITTRISNRFAGAPADIDCAAIAQVGQVRFPNRSLNGRQIVLYLQGGQWHCMTSLNKEQTPSGCTF